MIVLDEVFLNPVHLLPQGIDVSLRRHTFMALSDLIADLIHHRTDGVVALVRALGVFRLFAVQGFLAGHRLAEMPFVLVHLISQSPD